LSSVYGLRLSVGVSIPIRLLIILEDSMRQDIKRVKAGAVHIGDVLCFWSPLPSEDRQIWSIYNDGKKLVFNERNGEAVFPSDYVFIREV